jgi:hypothetical protein
MPSICLYSNTIHYWSIRFSRPNSPEANRILLFLKEHIGVVYIKIKRKFCKFEINHGFQVDGVIFVVKTLTLKLMS